MCNNYNKEQILFKFETPVLRRILGAVSLIGTWWQSTNAEVMKLYGDSNVIILVQLNRLRWAGQGYPIHVWDP